MKEQKNGILALSIKMLAKFGGKILSLLAKILKGGKAFKVVLAGASFASYAYLFTWQFALMIMLMLFVHESGHVWAMRKVGMKTKGFYFVPLLGGAAVAESDFPDRKSEVFVALMGPIWGFLLAVVAGVVYLFNGDPMYAAAASWMAMINLFNLLPINPLDGGRVFKSIAFSIHSKIGLFFLIVGVIASGFLAFYAGLGLFVFLLIVGSIDLMFEYQRRERKPEMTKLETAYSALSYLLVAGALWLLMFYHSHIPGAQAALEVLSG